MSGIQWSINKINESENITVIMKLSDWIKSQNRQNELPALKQATVVIICQPRFILTTWEKHDNLHTLLFPSILCSDNRPVKSNIAFIYLFFKYFLPSLVCFIPATTANDLQLRRNFHPRFYPLLFVGFILILEKEPVFPF